MNERSTKFFATLPTHSDLPKTEIVVSIDVCIILAIEIIQEILEFDQYKIEEFSQKIYFHFPK